jgi:hypothetical protein
VSFDLGDYIVAGQYNSKLDGDVAGSGVPGTALLGRRAFTGIKAQDGVVGSCLDRR